MNKNRTFTGIVNGKTYTDVADYNKAFLDAIGLDGTVTASIEFKSEDIEQEQYDYCLPDFELDELTGTAETDTLIIDDFIKQDLSADRINDILDRASKMNDTARAELVADVKDMIEGISTDIEDNNGAHTTLVKHLTHNEQEINQFQAKLDDLKEYKNKIQTQINITEGADQVLRASFEFYKTLYKQLVDKHPVDAPDTKVTGREVNPGTVSDPTDTTVTTSTKTIKEGHPGFILDPSQKEIARKLFKEIFRI